MPGLKRKNEATASTADSSDANTRAKGDGLKTPPAKRNCRQPSEPLHMVTRRSASIAASTQNSAASSAVQSEVEDNQPDAIRSGHSNTDESMEARKAKRSASRSNQSHSRGSSVQERREAKLPKLKLFVTKPPDSIELQKIKHTLRNRRGAVPSITQLSTERNNRKREAGRELDERAEVADTINQGDHTTALIATTQLPTESTETKREAGHDDEGTTTGEDDGTTSDGTPRMTTESNKEKCDAGHGDEKRTDVVDMAGVIDGASNGASLGANTGLPVDSNKRKREGEHQDDDGGHLATTIKEEDDATTIRVDSENPPAKKRGRFPKLGKVDIITSVERTPAPETSNGSLQIPAPAIKRPPGRPRKGRPPVSRQGSETATRRPPGRQRAPDANPEVEAIRIRMADLKRQYREVARGQEAALCELAERSVAELREGPNAHKQNDHFRDVQAGLDAHYLSNVIERERNYKRRVEYEEKKFKAEQEVLRRECENRRKEIKEAYINRLKHEYMRCVRGEEAKGDDEVTDDEVGLQVSTYLSIFGADFRPQGVNGFKSPVYNPHSARFNYETECSWRDWQRRLDLQRTLRAVNPPDSSVLPRAFTATDEGRRQEAVAEANLKLLALASEAAEEQKVTEDLPKVRSDGLKNAQLAMLDGLADLAEIHPEYWMSKEERERAERGKKGRKKVSAKSLEDHLQRAQRHGMEYFQEKNEEALQRAVRSQGSRPREIRPASERPPRFLPGVTMPLPLPPVPLPPPPPPPQRQPFLQPQPLLPQYWPPPPPPPQFMMPPPPFYGSQGLMGPPPLPQPPYFRRQW